jgi:hypothetical protein
MVERQPAATVAILADLNEIADIAGAGNTQRMAAVWPRGGGYRTSGLL